MVKSNLWCEHFFGTFKMENRWQCVCGQCWCRLSAVATVQFLFALHDSNFRNAGAGCLYMNIKMTNNKNFYEVWMGKCDVDFRIAYLSQKWPLAGKVFVSVGVCVAESFAFRNESLRNVYARAFNMVWCAHKILFNKRANTYPENCATTSWENVAANMKMNMKMMAWCDVTPS